MYDDLIKKLNNTANTMTQLNHSLKSFVSDIEESLRIIEGRNKDHYIKELKIKKKRYAIVSVLYSLFLSSLLWLLYSGSVINFVSTAIAAAFILLFAGINIVKYIRTKNELHKELFERISGG